MRASERCKENYQGDRCKKAKNHDLSVNQNPDRVHVGSFTAWDTDGLIVARLQKKAPKRSRAANRIVRAICAKQFNPNLVPRKERKTMKYFLDMAVKHFRGIQE
jgi:RAB protein geranylgeranyltransferase component A